MSTTVIMTAPDADELAPVRGAFVADYRSAHPPQLQHRRPVLSLSVEISDGRAAAFQG